MALNKEYSLSARFNTDTEWMLHADTPLPGRTLASCKCLWVVKDDKEHRLFPTTWMEYDQVMRWFKVYSKGKFITHLAINVREVER